MTRRTDGGYAMMAVIVITVLIMSGASILLLIGRDAGITGTLEKRSTEAHGIALAGLHWMLANLGNSASSDEARTAARTNVAFIAAPLAASPHRIHPFNADDRFIGVPGPVPAKGVSTTDWTAFSGGHYGLTVAVDPLDPRRSVLLRAIGVVGPVVVVLETNLRLRIVQSIPAGLTGCFDADFQVTWYDQEGPYDYTGNFRLDGGLGVPVALSADHNRMNGLARQEGSAPAIPSAIAGYTRGRRWRGTQSLRGGPLPTGIANRFGGTQSATVGTLDANDGPLPLWERNPFIANDPRLVDAYSVGTGARGLGLGDGGLVFDGSVVDVGAAVVQQRGVPLIAYIDAPAASQTTAAKGGTFGQQAWGGGKDDEARKGFYACDNHGGGNSTLNAAVEVCTKGSVGSGAADWGNNAVNHSGRAHGFVQSVLRQCTGSGASIDPLTGAPWHSLTNPNGVRCSRGFEWLENVAACLVVPRTVASANGSNGLRPGEDLFGAGNNFNGCHPGCLIATDVNGDDAITAEDRPFRSSCINLDASTTTTYGPGALPDKGGGVFAGLNDPYVGMWKLFNTLNAPLAAATDVATPTSPARFAAFDQTTVEPGGAVRERGNSAFITRLDMGDRGPLGTCEQNCLAYGFGRDRTWGAHRTDVFSAPGVAGDSSDAHCTATVPAHGAGTVVEHCNLDSDHDGFLDRKSYALNSAYREECADPHDGISWAPAFNISSANTMLADEGCSNDLPGRAATTPAQRITAFCDNGSDEALRNDIDAIAAQATTVNASALNKSSSNIVDGEGWWGGAVCHMGPTTTFGGQPHAHSGHLATLPLADVDRLGHPDWWIEDTCPDPVVVRVTSSANISIGKVCGCGILILPGQSLQLGTDSALLWRGVIIWDLKGASGKELKMSGAGNATLVVEGGMLMSGDDGIQINVSKGVGGGASITNTSHGETVKQLFHLNPLAIEDAFSAVKTPVRSIRRVH